MEILKKILTQIISILGAAIIVVALVFSILSYSVSRRSLAISLQTVDYINKGIVLKAFPTPADLDKKISELSQPETK